MISTRSRSLFRVGCAALGAGLLAACVAETAPQLTAGASQQATPAIAPNPGVSPAGATIAFVSLAGAPDAARKMLGDAMTSELATRQVKLAAQDNAHYLVRGHLIAVPGEKSITFSWIWDIYGADKHRRARIEDGLTLAATATDPWALFDAKTAAEVAGRSARELAAFLTHTPEAIAASKGAPAPGSAPRAPAAAAVVASGLAGAPPLGYSPLR